MKKTEQSVSQAPKDISKPPVTGHSTLQAYLRAAQEAF